MVESCLIHGAMIHHAAIFLTRRAAVEACVIARLGSEVSGLAQGGNPSQQQFDNSVRSPWCVSRQFWKLSADSLWPRVTRYSPCPAKSTV